jgi:hypothetical protein
MAEETRSVQQIKRETEATRAGLTDTVDQLRTTVADTATEIKERLRPDAIKAEVSEYVRSRGEKLLADVKEAAQRNPMQAVAVGASVAYPLLRVARAIPIPILMIGAGLFFAGSKKGRDLTQQASDVASDLAETTRQRGADLAEQFSQTAVAARDYATDTLEKTKGAIVGSTDKFRRSSSEVTGIGTGRVAAHLQDVRDTANAAADSLSSGFTDVAGKVADVARDAAGSLQDKVAGATTTLSQTVSDAGKSGQELFDSARKQAVDTGQRGSQSIKDTMEQNPLLVAGVGLLIGGFLASVLPKLQVEDAFVGPASDVVKNRAREVAARGLEAGKTAADAIVNNVADRAKEEGLMPEALGQRAGDVTQRLQRVAERAVSAAFEPEDENHAEGNGGQHG